MKLLDFLFPPREHADRVHSFGNAPQYDPPRGVATPSPASEGERDDTLTDIHRLAATGSALKMRIDELERDMGFVVLLLGSLLSALSEKGTLTRDEVKKELAEMDALDGLRDGRLTIRVLKQVLAGMD